MRRHTSNSNQPSKTDGDESSNDVIVCGESWIEKPQIWQFDFQEYLRGDDAWVDILQHISFMMSPHNGVETEGR